MSRPPAVRLLVVDDEQGLRDLACFLLEPLGYEVVTACNGAEAVSRVRESAFDLVLLDVHMPVMGGLEALARIRALRPTQRVVIVSGTSDVTGSFASSVVALGALACVFKPLGVDEITELIERTLSQQPRAATG